MSLKDSVKCLAPPSNPATLEAKVDDLRFKVDQLLTRSTGRGCPLCGTCAHHSTLQEAMTSQLSAQTRLLDSLERKVMEMRTALEDLACGVENKSFFFILLMYICHYIVKIYVMWWSYIIYLCNVCLMSMVEF